MQNDRKRPIYLDYNATTPTDERVLEAMIPYFRELYANPGSPHLFGLTAGEVVAEAREQVAGLVGARTQHITFTSGATESVNLAIKGLLGLASNPGIRNHIVTAATEHSAVLDTCRYAEKLGYRVTYLPVDEHGLVSLDALRESTTDDTLLVAIMLANNETGVIQPVTEVAKITHQSGAVFLCDATQAVGKIVVDVHRMGIDLMPMSAHKFYGPKGIGALYIAPHLKPEAQLHGGQQQNGLRSGTLNVPGIVGMAKACEIAGNEMEADEIRVAALRDRLEHELLRTPDTRLNGPAGARLYNTANITFSGISSESLILALQTISVSSGSACLSVTSKPSHVLKAMGLTDADALASIRFSLGRFTTEDEIDYATVRIIEAVSKLRG